MLLLLLQQLLELLQNRPAFAVGIRDAFAAPVGDALLVVQNTARRDFLHDEVPRDARIFLWHEFELTVGESFGRKDEILQPFEVLLVACAFAAGSVVSITVFYRGSRARR